MSAGVSTAVPIRARIVAAATELTTTVGWSSITMARLADHVGVSRQTVYNEVGTKAALAEAMVLEELSRFLVVVEAAFDEHPADLGEAMHGAVRGVLELARDSALLRAIVSPAGGGSAELLPPLTTDAGAVLSAATAVLRHRLDAYAEVQRLEPSRRDAAVDAVVRLVLSHVMQPAPSLDTTTEAITWTAERLLSTPPHPHPHPSAETDQTAASGSG